ncbi:hypothetical protein KI387_017207, partial [Taxus chinensis]
MKKWALKFGTKKIPLLVKPKEEVKVDEPVVDEVDFTVAIKQEDDQPSVCSECSFHNFILFEEVADPTQDAKSIQEEEEKIAPNQVEEEHME